MAYEIINNAQITPMRLHALLQLVSDYPNMDEKRIGELLQPKALYENSNAALSVLDAAVKCGLVHVSQDKKLSTNLENNTFTGIEGYRRLMQEVLLGVVEEEKNNFLLNIFIAWYAVLNEKALAYERMEFLAADFNLQVFPNAEGRSLNDTKLRGMDDWISFLGFGWNWDRGDYFLLPDATARIEPLLPDLLPKANWIPMGQFMQRLANCCPELDTGVLFERCWSAVYGQRVRGNQLSLMLSTALRTLQSTGKIQLDRVADAGDQWTLYEDVASEFSVITHICGEQNTK